jgi:hypothetical protein
MGTKKEPCLCVMFASETNDPDAMVCRLFQPCNFVLLNAFEGYIPIKAIAIKQAKAMKGMHSGGWYKKVWHMFSKVEQTEYKHNDNGPNVSAAPRIKPGAKDPQQKSSQGDAMSEDEKLEAGAEGDIEVGNNSDVDVVGLAGRTKPIQNTNTRPSIGEKSPRFTMDLSTFEGCEKLARQKLVKDRLDHAMQYKNANKFREKFNIARETDPDLQSEDFDASSASEESFDYYSDFERAVEEEAHDLWRAQKLKNPRRSPSAGSNSSGGGGKHKKFLNYDCFFRLFCCNVLLCM